MPNYFHCSENITLENTILKKLQESEEKLKKQNAVLLRLAKSKAIDSGDIDLAMKEITIAATETLTCDRSSVWVYNPEKTAIVCLDLFQSSKNEHYTGVELQAKDFPAYFNYLHEERVLPAHNAHTDPSTYEFSEIYLTPNGINSMLDAPIRLGGEMIGVICNEHVGPFREWTLEEQNFAGSLTDLISRAMESANRKKAQEELKRINENLEAIVEERTKELTKANGELSEAMEILKKTQKQLVESEKMASLGSLVAGVAHEINTPIGIGVTGASLLDQKSKEIYEMYKTGKMKKSDLDSFLQASVETSSLLLSNLNRAADLVQSFKQVAVDQSNLEIRDIVLSDYIGEILTSLQPRIKQTKVLVKVGGDNSVNLKTYPGVISQIVTNMVVNSLTHGFESQEEGSVGIDISKNGDRVLITHRDNGKGIAAEFISKIFDPFFTTRRGQGGTGLGLNIVYNLITQKLNGNIRCESEVGKGATFYIEIPAIIEG